MIDKFETQVQCYDSVTIRIVPEDESLIRTYLATLDLNTLTEGWGNEAWDLYVFTYGPSSVKDRSDRLMRWLGKYPSKANAVKAASIYGNLAVSDQLLQELKVRLQAELDDLAGVND